MEVGGDREHGLHQPAQGRAVALDLHAELQALAHTHDRHAMRADRAADDHYVARDHPLRTEVDADRDEADPGGVDEDAVAVTGVHDLGVAGRHLDARRARGCAQRVGHACDDRYLHAFLQDETAGEVGGPGSAHGQVVDGAVDREVADAAAGEEQRSHDVRVGGEGQPGAAQRHHGRVGQLRQHVAPVAGREDVLDQFGRECPAAAVAHHHPRLVAQRCRAGPSREVEDGRLAGSGRRRGGDGGVQCFGRLRQRGSSPWLRW